MRKKHWWILRSAPFPMYEYCSDYGFQFVLPILSELASRRKYYMKIQPPVCIISDGQVTVGDKILWSIFPTKVLFFLAFTGSNNYSYLQPFILPVWIACLCKNIQYVDAKSFLSFWCYYSSMEVDRFRHG